MMRSWLRAMYLYRLKDFGLVFFSVSKPSGDVVFAVHKAWTASVLT
jgi:hypothetical protein